MGAGQGDRRTGWNTDGEIEREGRGVRERGERQSERARERGEDRDRGKERKREGERRRDGERERGARGRERET